MTPQPDPSDPPRPRTLRAALTCARNEGLWLLEWVAYHRAIGFEKIFVASNDCTDGSDAMLDRLAELGHIIHIRNTGIPGVSPQEAGCRLALAHPEMADVEWLLHIDTDEFLHVSTGAGRIGDLLAAVGPADVITVSWRMFGSNGRRIWPGGLVLETCTLTESWLKRGRTLQKTLFRPELFRSIFAHMPKDPVTRDIVVKNTAGMVMPNDALFEPRQVRHKTAEVRAFTWANADIHHYAIRSLDVFLLKNVRGDGLSMTGDKYLRGSPFWNYADRNAVEDTAIQRHLPATRAMLDSFLADPALRQSAAEAASRFAALRESELEQAGRFGWHDPVSLETGTEA